MSATVTRDAIIHFVEGIISCFGDTYLRKPNRQDLQRLLYVGEQRGFPGMIGSIDCMHWEWKNCHTAWAGQYSRRSGKSTIILEVVASYDLWIWHAFFGTPGSCNDINVLHRSPVFSDILEGRAPKISYVVNGRQNDRAFYLTDGIYPSWAAFVKSITSPVLRKHKLFAQHQEVVRKDVERAFGVLQARFAFIRHPCLIWDRILMGKIMMACIIMHDMIVEGERDTYQTYYDPVEFLFAQHQEVVRKDVERTFGVLQARFAFIRHPCLILDRILMRKIMMACIIMHNMIVEDERDTYQTYYDPTEFLMDLPSDGEASFHYSTDRIASLSTYMANMDQLRNREACNALQKDM